MTSISLADELPVTTVPDEPFWSENFYFVGFDPAANISVVIHIGRWSKDTNLWREQVLIFLPDGSFALSHGVGARPSAAGPSGALLGLTCEEPGKRWRLQFRGPTRPTTRDELMRGKPLGARPMVLMDLDLKFESEAAIWDFGSALRGETWTTFHYEQPGQLSGRIEIDGAEWDVAALAHRDHSRGPRSYAGIQKGIWMQGHFPGGRSFAVLDTAFEGKGEKKLARVFDGGREYEAQCSQLPTVSSDDALPVEFDILITSELGEMRLHGAMDRGLPKRFDARNEPLYGTFAPDGFTALIALIGPVTWEWDETGGVGHVDWCWGPRTAST